MDEEDRDFSRVIAKIAEEATHEAYIKAREVMGITGIVLAKDNQLIRLFPDDSFELIRYLTVTTGQ